MTAATTAITNRNERSDPGDTTALTLAALVGVLSLTVGLSSGLRGDSIEWGRGSRSRPRVRQDPVDARGRTLYLFEKDKSGKSACSGKCATFWPPLMTSGKPIAAAGAKASLLGTTKRADGRLQVTQYHHPLYTFVKDTRKGQTKGQGLDFFWRRVVRGLAGRRDGREGSEDRQQRPPSPGYGSGYGS